MHSNHQFGHFDKIILDSAPTYAIGTQVLAADLTVAAGGQGVLALDAGSGNRNVTLPTIASSIGVAYWIVNNGAANNLVIKKSDGTTLFTLLPGQSTHIFNDGVTWFGGVSATTVGGVAGGYKIARGSAVLDGSNPTPIATGLATVISFVATQNRTTAPGLNTSLLTADIAGAAGNVNVYGWKPTGAGDATLIASTGTESFYWIAVGT